MQNTRPIISYRYAAKLEHPDGVSLSKTYSEHGFVLNGLLRLSFDPPIANKNTISVGTFGGVNGSNDQFSGTLETGYAGDVFAPSQSLISSVKKMVHDMAEDMNVRDEDQKHIIVEEIINSITIHVPVRQIYTKIRQDFPVEYRAMDVDYKRRSGASFDENMFILVSKQQRQIYQFSKLSRFSIRTAFLQNNELVKLNEKKLQKLKRDEPQVYEEFLQKLEGVDPINGAYVVLNGEQNRQVVLVGKNSKNQYVKTKSLIPVQYLDPVSEEDEEDDLTPEERRDYGFETHNNQPSNQQSTAPKPMTEYEKANDIFVKTIQSWAKSYADNKQYSGESFQNPKGRIMQVKLEASNIPAAVYTDKKTALQYRDKIIGLFKSYFNRKYQIFDPQFLAIYEYLTT